MRASKSGSEMDPAMPFSFMDRLPSSLDFKTAAGLLTSLPAPLHRRIDAIQAREIIRARLRSREQLFMRVIKDRVFGNPNSPYLMLMQNAGLEPGDVERLARREGVEGALKELMKAGVYLTVEEFKGRRPAKRGSQTIRTGPANLRGPQYGFGIPAHTGGSRSGKGTPVYIDPAYAAQCAANTCLFFHFFGGDAWIKGAWGVPGSGIIFRLLVLRQFGAPVKKWFSQLDTTAPGLHPRYRYSGKLLHWASLLSARPIPAPEYIPLDDASPIARWMHSMLLKGESPLLWTFPSSAIRICHAASELGLDLGGARFAGGGEPVTKARMQTIRESGGRYLTRYGSVETGDIANLCKHHQGPDDLHLQHDLHAVIQAGGQAQKINVPTEALFITNLMPSSPFVMLNTSLGDQAEFMPGDCGCPMGRIWPIRIRNVRSFEKLTGAGMSFLDTQVIRVLEEILPRRFGGLPTDYQLLELEDPDGAPRLQLLARPSLGPMDEGEVVRVFIDSLTAGSGASAVMGMTWLNADILKVERRAPMATASGKILHLHQCKAWDGGGGAARSER